MCLDLGQARVCGILSVEFCALPSLPDSLSLPDVPALLSLYTREASRQAGRLYSHVLRQAASEQVDVCLSPSPASE